MFVGGIHWDATDSDLESALGEFGAITEAKVIMDRDTGKSRGFGFVTFASADDAEKAIASNGIEILGRIVRIDKAEDKGRGGRRGRDRNR